MLQNRNFLKRGQRVAKVIEYNKIELPPSQQARSLSIRISLRAPLCTVDGAESALTNPFKFVGPRRMG